LEAFGRRPSVLVSIVVPAFNGEENLGTLWRRPGRCSMTSAAASSSSSF
jgi:hypothetical protein